MKRARRRTLLQALLLLPLCKSSTNVRPTGQSHASYSKGLDIDEHVRHFRGRYETMEEYLEGKSIAGSIPYEYPLRAEHTVSTL